MGDVAERGAIEPSSVADFAARARGDGRAGWYRWIPVEASGGARGTGSLESERWCLCRREDEELVSGPELDDEPEDEFEEVVDADKGSVERALRPGAGTDPPFSASRPVPFASYATAGTAGGAPNNE